MTTYDNTNSGTLFKNDKKAKDTDPAYKGQINVEGKEYWMSSWVKTSKQGASFMSIKLTAKDRQSSEPTRKAADLPDEDLPF
jgi:uncharacterized protein (DUF736 family)